MSRDVAGEREAAEAWFARWRPQLSYCSENRGCGCCVDLWDVEGPDAAIEELPPSMSAMSDWSRPRPSNAKADRALEQKLDGRRHRARNERRR